MLIDQDKELKEAILELPEKEKIKLLLKLISKDITLMNQLRHQLVDGHDSVDQKRELVLKKIDGLFGRVKRLIEHYPARMSPGELLMHMREISGLVNQHVLITKDKIGDIELRLHILQMGFAMLPEDALLEPNRRNKTLVEYIAGRMKYILPKYRKLHEDYQYDLKDSMNAVLLSIYNSAVSRLATELNFPKQV